MADDRLKAKNDLGIEKSVEATVTPGRKSKIFQAFEARFNRARDAGLVASAYVYYTAVTEQLAGGYTSGDFVTGNVLGSVTVGQPVGGTLGFRTIRVGTNVLYAAFWEFGHRNIFTGRYERVEIWRPTMMAQGERMTQAFHRTFHRILNLTH